MNRLRAWLPFAILISGLVYIGFIPEHPDAVKLLFKLIPMAFILTYAYALSPSVKQRSHWLLLAGIVFCMIGDGTMHWFTVGLSAFLVGHLFYIARFATRWRFHKIRAAALVPIALYAAFMGHRLVTALSDGGKAGLIVPVVIYIAAISLMVWTAVMSGRPIAIAGALLFLASDSVLSWNLFVSDVAHSGVWIMTTYYAAQFLIARSMRETAALEAHSANETPIMPI